jgi:serine/threonine protein kinase
MRCSGRAEALRGFASTQADPYLDKDARQEEFKKISNAYRAVAHMPTHANILAVEDLFVNDDEDLVVLVTEDLPAQALRLHLTKSSMALTFDQKRQIMRNLLTAFDHAHRHEVIHRNLTPHAILVTKGGQARVTGFDYARTRLPTFACKGWFGRLCSPVHGAAHASAMRGSQRMGEHCLDYGRTGRCSSPSVFFGWFSLAAFGVSLLIIGRILELSSGYEDIFGISPPSDEIVAERVAKLAPPIQWLEHDPKTLQTFWNRSCVFKPVEPLQLRLTLVGKF